MYRKILIVFATVSMTGWGYLPSLEGAERTSGIYLRPVTLKPSIHLKYGYHSNVFRRSTKVLPGYSEPLTRIASGYLDVVPELGASMGIMNWLLLNNLRMHLTYFHNQEAEKQSTTSFPEFLGDHLAKWRSRGRGFAADVEEKWKITSEPIVQDVPQQVGGERIRRFYNKLGGRGAFTSRSGYFAAKMSYLWERNQYLEDRLSLLNYGIHNITLHGENAFLPKTSAGLSVRYRNAHWDDDAYGEDRNYHSANFIALVNGQLTEKVSSTFALGYEFLFFESDDFLSQPVIMLKGIWKPRVTTEVEAVYRRSVHPSVSSRTYSSNTVELLGEFRGLRPRGLELRMGFEFELDQYEGVNARDVQVYNGHSGVNYQFGGSLEWLRFGLEYGFELSRCDYSFYYYDVHRVLFSVFASY